MLNWKDKKEVKTRPRTNLNGGDLVRSTFPILTFSFTLAFISTLVLALVLAFRGQHLYLFVGQR